MAIITKFQIPRYKEVQYNTPAGTVDDGQFGTFSLDNPANTDSGTIHFFGLMKNVVLLGEVLRITLDTGNITVQQFNNLTYNAVQQNIANGLFQLEQETIGWVVLGDARKSFYYTDCSIGGQGNDGKRPTVEYYYDFENIFITDQLVSGDENSTSQFLTGGPPNPALGVVGTFNSSDTFFNWGTTPYPGQQPLSLEDYIRAATTGGRIQSPPGSPDTITVINSQRIDVIPLFLADKGEHFDNVNVVPNSSGRYGRVRSQIEGFSAFVTSQGNCIPTGVIVPSGGSTGVGTGETPIESETPPTSSFYIENSPLITKCPEPISINFPPKNVITDQEFKNYLNNLFVSSGEITNPPSSRYLEMYSGMETTERQMDLLRKSYQTNGVLSGIRDPREFISDNSQIPTGFFHIWKNDKKCTNDVFLALRDKDGDIPEPIGPVVSYYFYKTRESLVGQFNLPESPLKYLGVGSDGYSRFSDGNSYTELLGEAVLGCGDPLSFGLDIPEVIVEIDKNNTEFAKQFGSADDLGSGENVIGRRILDKGLFFQNTITHYITDISYGIPTLTRLTDSEISDITKDSGTQFEKDRIINAAKRWENVIHPVYDLIWDTSGSIDVKYDQLDDSLSIYTNETVETVPDNTTVRQNFNWEWFLSKGLSNFKIGVKGKFGTGPEDPTTTRVDIDYVAIGKIIISLAILLIEEVFGEDPSLKYKNPRPTTVEQYRSRFTPRRLHKRGNLTLLSKSGKYATRYKPCEQIFLGFSDDYYDVAPEARRSNIEKLSKKDRVGYIPLSDESRNSQNRLQLNSGIVSNNTSQLETPILTESNFQIGGITSMPMRLNMVNMTNTSNEEVMFNPEITSIQGNCLSVVRRLVNIREESTGEILSPFRPAEFNGYPLTMYKCRLVADVEECCAEFYDPINTQQSVFRTIAKNVVIAESEVSAWYRQCTVKGDFKPYYESFYRVSDIGSGKNGLKNLNSEWAYSPNTGIKNIYWNEECSTFGAFDSFTKYRDFTYRAISPDESSQFDYGRGDDRFRFRLKYNVYNPGGVASFNLPGEKTTQSYEEYEPTKNGIVESLFDPNNIVVIMSRVCGYDPCSNSVNSLTETTPALFPRVKKYGRNPLLDIFYLNVVNPVIQYGGDGSISNRYSNQRLFSHPSRVPFRRSPSNTANDWDDLKYGQFPSIFPQNWNSIKLSADYNEINGVFSDIFRWPDALTDELSGVSYGDRFWKNKVKNTILELKDRWELSVNNIEEPIAILRDKTPILDLYFGLMELHVKGVSWKEILQYVDFAISCVSGTKYSEKIDVERLEKLWKIVENRLLDVTDVLETAPWPNNVEDLDNTFYVGSHDFGEVLMIEKTKNVSDPSWFTTQIAQTNLKSIYGGSIIIQNRSELDVVIESITIEPITTLENNILDIYGRTSSDYFFIGTPHINEWDGTSPPRLIPNSIQNRNANLTTYELPIWFLPQMAQEKFEYSALVNVRVNIGGEISTVSGLITGRCIGINATDSDADSVNNPLYVSEEDIRFQYSIDNSTANDNTQSINYYNSSPYDKVKVISFEVQNLRAFNYDGTEFELPSNEVPFKFLNRNGTPINSNKFEVNQELSINTDLLYPQILNTEISFVPSVSQKVYFGNVLITYSITDRKPIKTIEENIVESDEPTDTTFTGGRRRRGQNTQVPVNTIEFTKTIRLIGISF